MRTLKETLEELYPNAVEALEQTDFDLDLDTAAEILEGLNDLTTWEDSIYIEYFDSEFFECKDDALEYIADRIRNDNSIIEELLDGNIELQDCAKISNEETGEESTLFNNEVDEIKELIAHLEDLRNKDIKEFAKEITEENLKIWAQNNEDEEVEETSHYLSLYYANR